LALHKRYKYQQKLCAEERFRQRQELNKADTIDLDDDIDELDNKLTAYERSVLGNLELKTLEHHADN